MANLHTNGQKITLDRSLINKNYSNKYYIGSEKVEETISVSRSSAAGSSLTKNTKRRKSFKLKHRRNSLKDSSLKIFSCLVSDVHDTEDASITSLKSSMPKSTRYEEKSSCAIM